MNRPTVRLLRSHFSQRNGGRAVFLQQDPPDDEADGLDGGLGVSLYRDIGQLTKAIRRLRVWGDARLAVARPPVGRVTSMTDYHGATTAYEYDDGGRLTLLTAPGSKVWEFVYNDLGQPIETYNPYGTAAKSRFFQCNPGGLKGLTRIVTRLRGGNVW